MTADVFEEDPLGGTLPDDPGDLRPKVARIVGAAPFASGAEGLAGISSEDGVESAAKWPGIETSQVVPDWGRTEITRALGGDEDGAWPVLPLDEGASVEARFGQHDAQIQASAACAEGQSVPGT